MRMSNLVSKIGLLAITMQLFAVTSWAQPRSPIIEQISKAGTPVAKYISRWADEEYMWDELAAAAWLDPSIITKTEEVYMDIDIDHGASYGHTLTWAPGANPGLGECLVQVNVDLNLERFYRIFIDLMTRPTPGAGSSDH